MRKGTIVALALLVAAALPVSLPRVSIGNLRLDGWIAAAHAESPSASELRRRGVVVFDKFLDNHPQVAKDLARNPNLVNNPNYLKDHDEFREFLKGHPNLRESLRDNPDQWLRGVHNYDRWREHRGDRDYSKYFDSRREQQLRGCYARTNYGGKGLPPGLQKQYDKTGHLPPGLEKHVAEHGSLPPGLQKKIQPVDPMFASCAGPLPPNTRLFRNGNDLVLMNERAGQMVDMLRNFY
ncbi:MAG: hypothetical protein ACREQF_09815 [Candidatus Binataceae bacterium]